MLSSAHRLAIGSKKLISGQLVSAFFYLMIKVFRDGEDEKGNPKYRKPDGGERMQFNLLQLVGQYIRQLQLQRGELPAELVGKVYAMTPSQLEYTKHNIRLMYRWLRREKRSLALGQTFEVGNGSDIEGIPPTYLVRFTINKEVLPKGQRHQQYNVIVIPLVDVYVEYVDNGRSFGKVL